VNKPGVKPLEDEAPQISPDFSAPEGAAGVQSAASGPSFGLQGFFNPWLLPKKTSRPSGLKTHSGGVVPAPPPGFCKTPGDSPPASPPWLYMAANRLV